MSVHAGGKGPGHKVRTAPGAFSPGGTPATTLSALALSPSSVPEDSAVTINVTGATSGSTISLFSGALPTGMALSSALRTISGTPPTPATYSFTLRETLAGATNTPRDTALSIVVTAVAGGGGQTAFNNSANSALLAALMEDI